MSAYFAYLHTHTNKHRSKHTHTAWVSVTAMISGSESLFKSVRAPFEAKNPEPPIIRGVVSQTPAPRFFTQPIYIYIYIYIYVYILFMYVCVCVRVQAHVCICICMHEHHYANMEKRSN